MIAAIPAWPCEQSVDFKLHGPGNTTVEIISYRAAAVAAPKVATRVANATASERGSEPDDPRAGTLLKFLVDPLERKSAVIFAGCVQQP